MKSLVQFAAARWHMLLMLMLASFVIAACTLTDVPEDTQTLFEGAPVVNIASPQPNDTYYEDVGVNIIIRVENAGPDIARVAITLDGQIIGEATLPNAGGAPSFVVTNSWTATGVGSHTIGAVVSRNDGTASTPVEVPINVVEALASNTDSEPTGDTNIPTQAPTTADSQSVQPTTAPTNTSAPTTAPEPTTEPEPTSVPATATSSRPQVRVTTGANIRSGAGTAFEPPIGSLAAGAVQDLLAVHTSGQWYKIRYYNGEGWIFANTVEVIGDISSLPREAGPPTPIPFTPTPVATATPVAVADLSITAARTSPFPFECGRDSEISVTIANSGSGASGETRVVIEDLYNGQVQGSTQAPVRALNPGENMTVTMYLRVNTYVAEGHTSRIRVDPDNRVAETNENNNTDQDDYVLASGSC